MCQPGAVCIQGFWKKVSTKYGQMDEEQFIENKKVFAKWVTKI